MSTAGPKQGVAPPLCAGSWVLLFAVAAAGCSDGSSDNPSSKAMALVKPSAWSPLDDAEDPFRADKPSDAICDSLGYAVEDLEEEPAFFVDTEACDYLSVEQPALTAVAVGDMLHLRLYHYELTADEPSQAQLAIAFGAATEWHQSLEIPAQAELIDTSWQAEHALDIGDRVVFHLNNHGDNNYVLLELSKLP